MQTQSSLSGYTAHPDFINELESELKRNSALRIVKRLARIFVVEGPSVEPLWSHNNLRNIEQHAIRSISEAQKVLKAKGKFWHLHPAESVRRSKLIQEGLPHWKMKPLEFLGKLPTIPLGHWTLENDNTLWLSADCSTPFPDGEIQFNENKTDPPSRAYLKLWEFFTLHKIAPKPGETCVDLGSAPGGWTWVLDVLETKITSVDKADLNLKNPSRTLKKLSQDAFTLKPIPTDWLFSDLICYPDKLFELVQEWLKSGLAKNFVCTIKFQGPTDYKALERFKSIPGSTLEHLWCNKHEVTWSLLDKNPKD